MGWRCGQQEEAVGRGARLNGEPEVGMGCSQPEGQGEGCGGTGWLGPGVGPRVHGGHVRNQPGAGWGPARGGAGAVKRSEGCPGEATDGGCSGTDRAPRRLQAQALGGGAR